MLLFTTIPISMTKPTNTLEFVSVFPVRRRAMKEPMPASGMVNISTMGAVKDSNTDANIIYMIRADKRMRKLKFRLSSESCTMLTPMSGLLPDWAIISSTSSRAASKRDWDSAISGMKE